MIRCCLILVKNLTVLSVVALCGYVLWWGIWYRLPRGSSSLIDKRSDTSQQGEKLVFRAGLANNPHGFPGHAYVIWLGHGGDVRRAESMGYGPNSLSVLVPSLFMFVPGIIGTHVAQDNFRNIEELIVVVDEPVFQRTRQLWRQWDTHNFRTGVRDCCSFVDFIAADAGLKVPHQLYMYPQDHMSLLKKLNTSSIFHDKR